MHISTSDSEFPTADVCAKQDRLGNVHSVSRTSVDRASGRKKEQGCKIHPFERPFEGGARSRKRRNERKKKHDTMLRNECVVDRKSRIKKFAITCHRDNILVYIQWISSF